MYFRLKKWRFVLFASLFTLAAFWLARGTISSFFHQSGLNAKSEWRTQAAIGYFEWALFFKENFDSRYEKGLCLQLRGNFLESQKILDALSQAGIEDKAKLARLHNALGVNHYSFAEPDAAAASHQKALEFARDAGIKALEAESLIGLSRVYYHSRGKFNEALAGLEKARSIAREISDAGLEAAALRNIGTVYWWFKGELDRPHREFYLPALELYRKQNDRRGEATMLTLIALVYNSKGDVYRFMEYQNESIAIQERIGDEAGLSDSYITMGQLYDGIGNYRKAREFYAKGLEITGRTDYRLAQGDLEALQAQVHVNLDEFDEAIKLFDPFSRHEESDSVHFNVTGVAYSYQLKGEYETALRLYERALLAHRQTETPDVRFEAGNLLRSAECAVSLDDWARAEAFLKQSEAIFHKIETHSDGEIQAAIVRAKIAKHEGRHDEALKYLEDALETERYIFASSSTNFLIPPHRRHYENLYNFLLDYSVSDIGEKLSEKASELAFAFLENGRYRSLRNFLIRVREKRADAKQSGEKERELVERLKKLSRDQKQNNSDATREQLRRTYIEYEDLTLKAQLEEPQYLAMRAAKPVSLSELQQKIPAETALIEFLFAGERVFVLIITQKDLRSVLLPVTKSNLAAKTKIFRSLIFHKEINENWVPVSESLRNELIEPMERSGALATVKRIGFVPLGFLRDLPFAALAARKNENIKFLIEDYVLFQTPSATFYAHTEQQPATGFDLSQTVAFGRNDFPEENLSTLAFAVEEANAIAEITGGTAFTNRQATETALKQLSGKFDHLHLSTHAVAQNEMPLLSRLLLEASENDDGQLTVREIFELNLQTKLAVLSACETGQSFSASGNDLVEQDRIGLIEAFLHAGSKSVLATQFPVSDRATTEFMKDFYTNLREKDKAESLAIAQRKMLQERSQNDYKHPRFWSPFILVGTDR